MRAVISHRLLHGSAHRTRASHKLAAFAQTATTMSTNGNGTYTSPADQLDQLFTLDPQLLHQTVDILSEHHATNNVTHKLQPLPAMSLASIPPHPTSTQEVLDTFLPHIVQGATKLNDETYCTSMDCPVLNVAHAINVCSVWQNQNLLHAATSPVSTEAEHTVIRWLCQLCDGIFDGGQMTVGATVSTLTALWVARDHKKCKRVIASSMSHLSISKCANLLGMEYISVACDSKHHMRLADIKKLGDLSDAAVVCTAGTTISGAIDEMTDVKSLNAGWLHADAAWGGGLYFSKQHKAALAGVEHCDSFCISAHKLLMQPKGTSAILFKNWQTVNECISFGGAYLTHPNIGVLGSKSAMGEALLGSLITLGQSGLQSVIDRVMDVCDRLWKLMQADERFVIFAPPETGCLIWRMQHKDGNTEQLVAELVRQKLCTSVVLDGVLWCRNVSCNPLANPELIFKRIVEVSSSH